MRIATLTTVAALALAAAAACNTETGNDVSTDVNLAEDAAANDVLGANATANAALPTDASGFANAVAAADLYEVESARLAADKASNAEVKSLAQHIRTDHEKSTSELKSAAGTANISVAPKLDAEMQGMLDQLKTAARGADFDKLYIEQQKTAHQKALDLLKGYSSAGDNEALKAFATKTSAAVKSHLDHANSIKL
jgi:putative membrane protein